MVCVLDDVHVYMTERVRGWVLCGVCVCVTGCVCVSVCVPWHTWRSEDNLRGLVLSYFLKAESLKQPEMVASARLPIAGPVLPSLCGMAEITDGHRHMDFLHWFQGTSSAFQPRLCKNHFHPPNHPRASVIFFSLCVSAMSGQANGAQGLSCHPLETPQVLP